MKKSIVLAGTLLFGVAGVAHSFYYENSTPHNQTNLIECTDCHAAPAWGDPAGSKPYLLNNVSAQGGTDCLVCHINNDGKNYSQFDAPLVMTHGSAAMGEQYGKWSFNCWDCHQNHDDPPATPSLVTGTLTGMTNYGDGMVFNLGTYTVYNFAVNPPVPNSCSDPLHNYSWCSPDQWMSKTSEQTPYDPVADGAAPAAPEFANGPCDSSGPNYDPNYDCTVGVKPGERGLMLWVTLNSGTRAGFEVVDATSTQVTVKGQIPAGDSFSVGTGSPKPFELQYGMMVKNTVANFGFCSPNPTYYYCYDAVAKEYTQTCDPQAPNCANGETCSPRAMVFKCETSSDCPSGEVCQALAQPTGWTGNVAFGEPRKLAYDESNDGTDPTPNGICQVCHTRTLVWRSDGTGADHNNGMICTSCHLHTAGFAPVNCSACHNKYPTVMPITYLNPKTGQNDGNTGSVSAGAHSKHAGEYRFACQMCHSNGMPKTDVYDQRIQIGFDVYGIPGTGTQYYGQDTIRPPFGYQGTNGTEIILPGNQSWTSAKEMTCSNVYCHGQGKRLIQGFDLPSRSNPWNAASSDIQNDNFTCNNCHGFPPTFDAHDYHASRGFGCELCHAATVTKKANATVNQGYEITNKKNHVNGKYDVEPGMSFYSRREWHDLSFIYTPLADGTGVGGECSNNTCHQYFNYQDPYRWVNRTQLINNAKLTVTQGNCSIPTPPATNASSTVTVSASATCAECIGPYTCDFDWGDGTIQKEVPCNTTHTYNDKIPAPYDPDGSVIGGWNVNWTIRDSFNVTLPEPMTTRVEVCPKPNVPPVANKQIYLGPNPNTVDLCLRDLSYDSDYNVGSHWGGKDPITGFDIIVPGAISINWGYVPGVNTTVEGPITLTNVPSNVEYCFTYPVRTIYTISHQIKDNAADAQWVRSPVARVKVTSN